MGLLSQSDYRYVVTISSKHTALYVTDTFLLRLSKTCCVSLILHHSLHFLWSTDPYNAGRISHFKVFL